MEHVTWLKDFLVFLAAAGIAVPLLHRAGIGAVLSFLLIGVVIGPSGLGRLAHDFPLLSYLTIDDPARAAPFAELGVMFLLFLIGLELSVERLNALRRFVFGMGSFQFGASALAIFAICAAFGARVEIAVTLGLCLAMSSTALVMQLLEDEGRVGSPAGQVALSVLLFQDLMVAPVLFVIGLLAAGGGDWTGLAVAIGYAVAAIVIILGAGRYVVTPVLRFAAQTGSRELIMAITLLILIGLAVATARVGLSAALGAFLAGLVMSKTEFRHQIAIDLVPFKGLLLGLFFIGVGMSVDLPAVWAHLPVLAAAFVALLILKAIILWIGARLAGVGTPLASEVAILLPQAGEFGLVAVTVASVSILPRELAQVTIALIVLTMVATPLLASAARRVGAHLQTRSDARELPLPDGQAFSDHVVIGGFGRVGQAVATVLTEMKIPFVALDSNARLVTANTLVGCTVFFGDASRAELLDSAGAARARAFVVTVDEAEAAQRMVGAIRRISGTAPILARASDHKRARELLAAGAIDVVPETVDASLQLAARLLEQLGFPEEAIAHTVDQIRDRELARLKGDSGT